VRVQAAHNREHGWSISFTLCKGLHTLPKARVKVPKHFGPNHAMLIRHHTTLTRRDCIQMLWSLYKGLQETNDPHNYGSRRTITLPSGQHLSKDCHPKRTGLYPCNPDPPLLLLEKGHQINRIPNKLAKVRAIWHYGCTCFLGWFSICRLNLMILYYQKHRH
jgi:hypothetical protein